MKLWLRISIVLLCGFLLAGCSARQVLKDQVELIYEPENSDFDTYTACYLYLDLLNDTYEPDMQAFETCLDNSIKGDGTNAQRFCRLLADSGSAVSPTLQQKCLAGAEAYARGELRQKNYSEARDKFLQAVNENMPFVDMEEARRIAERIYNTQYLDQNVDLLNRIALAANGCEGEAAPIEEFWQGVQAHTLGDSIQETLLSTVQRMIQDIDRRIAEQRVDCARTGMNFLADLLAGGPVPDAAQAEVAARMPAWLDACVQRMNRGEYMDAFSLLRGVRALAQVQGDTGAVDGKIAELVERFANQRETPQHWQDSVSYLCSVEGAKWDPGYAEFLKLALTLEPQAQGKFLNCTGIQIIEALLPTSLAEMRYVVTAEPIPSTEKLVKSCDYSGGHVLVIYSADYQFTVKEIVSGKPVAETILPGMASGECELFRTFISQADRYNLPPDETELIGWLSSLQLP